MYRDNESGLHLLELELTNRCPLACRHCYVAKQEAHDAPAETIRSLIAQAAALGVNRLVFTGGDPLLIDGLVAFAEEAKVREIPEVALLTTGILISPRNVASLAVFDIVQMSVEIAEADGAFRPAYAPRLAKAVRLLQRHGIQPYLYATLHRASLPHLRDMAAFAESLGVAIGFNKLVAVGNDPHLRASRLRPDEYRHALAEVAALRAEGKRVNWGDPMMFLFDEQRFARMAATEGGIVGGCIAGIGALYVTVSGDAYPCPFVPVSCGNVHEQTLAEIWEDSAVLARLRDRSGFDGKCGSCELVRFCGGCRAASLLTHGEPFASDPNCLYAPEPGSLALAAEPP